MTQPNDLHRLAAAFGAAASEIHHAAAAQVRHDANQVEADAARRNTQPGTGVVVAYGETSARVSAVAPSQVQSVDGAPVLDVDAQEAARKLAGEMAQVGKTVLMNRLRA